MSTAKSGGGGEGNGLAPREIAARLRQAGEMLRLRGESRYRAGAYEWIRSARRRGTKFVISVDAHATSELNHLRFGVGTARRGGLRRGDVLNTLPARAFADAVRP